jgi:hypothetical protein
LKGPRSVKKLVHFEAKAAAMDGQIRKFPTGGNSPGYFRRARAQPGPRQGIWLCPVR